MAVIRPFANYEKFCSKLVIQSKEYGSVPLRFWGTQRHFATEIESGLENGIHHFVVLKGRQGGITTAGVAIVPYWLFQYPGIQGAFITDTDSNKTYFRSILNGYLDSLPRNMKVPVLSHNREMLVFKNKSLLTYLTAGTRKKREGGELGRAKGLNYLHSTECASYADEDELLSLVDSLAQIYEHRLYIFESTARGFGVFYDMWEDAKKAHTQKAIFIGWWLKEIYQFAKDTQIYRVYWDGKLSGEEKEWVKEVKAVHGHEITGEQMAWWRWMLHEEKHGDLNNMYQEHPPTADMAFVVSGYKFFNSTLLTKAFKHALKQTYRSARYTFGSNFEDTMIHPTTKVNAELKIWEEPVKGGVYVVGGDPAYGLNDKSDKSVAEVFRCYSNRLVQVAEFCAPGIRTDQFAWVLLHLAGAYRGSMLNVELTGPGYSVLNELNNIKKSFRHISKTDGGKIWDALSCMSWFLYSREDSIGTSFAYHSKTSGEQKENMLNRMKDMWERGELIINSADMISEAKYFARDGNVLEGRGGANDDRVIGVALAVLAHIRWKWPALMRSGQTYETVSKQEKNNPNGIQSLVLNFLKQQGVK